MKANKQSQIKISKSGFKRSRFNWSHDVNTTFNWGEIQPTQCKLLIPGSKTTMQAQNLIRLAPMVAPTFGRVKYKTYNQFVELAEIFPNFDALMAQEPKTTAGGTFVPQSLPYCKLSELSSWCFHGARATVYFAVQSTEDGVTYTPKQNAERGFYVTAYRKSPGLDLEAASVFLGYRNTLNARGVFDEVADPYFSSTSGLYNVGRRVVLDLSKIYPTDSINTSCVFPNVKIPLAAKYNLMMNPVDRGYTDPISGKIPDYTKEVTMESADLVIEGCSMDSSGNNPLFFAIALEMNDAGKRFRKILQGCGYQIDLTSEENVSILPLLAQYKAYFDIFGLQLYQGWETTYASKLIKYIENNFITAVATGWSGSAITDTNANAMIYFILNEIMNEWYTEDPDYIGAHMEKLAVSPEVNTSGFISVDSLGAIKFGANISDPTSLGPDNTSTGQNSYLDDTYYYRGEEEVHGFINQVQHGQVDAEILKRMYKWTNRNSILGREIAKILRAQGLGKYVDECKSNYIGSSDVMVTISDVISTADTSDGENGAALGQYGGRGLQYDSTGTLVFENDNYGYWVTLATIVPEAGYTQGLDRTLTSLGKFDLYNPDFDAVGMELTPKNAVVATNYIVGREAYEGHTGFGFIPRYSKFKVCNNVTNGDFNRHGKRNTYLPYTLDKQINVNDYNEDWNVYTDNFTSQVASTNAVRVIRSNAIKNMPIAGNLWRMPTKYAWLGNYDRIFLNDKYDVDSSKVNTYSQQLVGFEDWTDDNFLSHSIYDVKCYAPMKPIEDSYGLDDDEADHAGSEFVSKA